MLRTEADVPVVEDPTVTPSTLAALGSVSILYRYSVRAK
jgi:hypothetical protein